MPVFEVFPPAVLGGVDVVSIVGWVGVAAMVVVVGFLVFLALGPGTQPYQAERAEPTPTDDSRGDDTDTRYFPTRMRAGAKALV